MPLEDNGTWHQAKIIEMTEDHQHDHDFQLHPERVKFK